MNKQSELKLGAEQKRWQDSAKYAESKAKLKESQVQEREMIDEYHLRKNEELLNEKSKANQKKSDNESLKNEALDKVSE